MNRKKHSVPNPVFATSLIFWMSWVCTSQAEIVATDVLSGAMNAKQVDQLSGEKDAELLAPAVAAFRAGDRKQFELHYTQAWQTSERLPPIEIAIARLWIEAGQLAEASKIIERLLSKQRDEPEAYLVIGEIAMTEGRCTEAWLSFRHCSQLIEERKLRSTRLSFVVPRLTDLKALVAEQRQDWDEAEKHLKRLAELQPSQSSPLWRLGRIQLLRGDVSSGVQTMSNACHADAALPSPELTAAMHFAAESDVAKAEEWFVAAIRKDKNDAVRWSEFLNWLILNERIHDAERALRNIPSSAKAARQVRRIEALVARMQGDLAQAEQILSALMQEDATDVATVNQWTLVLIESLDEAKRQQALALSEQMLNRTNPSQDVVATAAWVHFKLGNVDAADRMLGKLASESVLLPQTAYYVARVLQAKGQVDDAWKVLEVAARTPGIFVERSKVREELEAQGTVKSVR